jgi:hypothetical protein
MAVRHKGRSAVILITNKQTAAFVSRGLLIRKSTTRVFINSGANYESDLRMCRVQLTVSDPVSFFKQYNKLFM